MTAQPSQTKAENVSSVKLDPEKTSDSNAPVDLDDLDLSGSEEDTGLSLDDELANKKLVGRRKIEMYWEKKRLQEQLGDLEEVDFDF
jgi:hypothetical protein